MKQEETICWRCRNAGCRVCPWDESKGSEPTPGWTAIPQILPAGKRLVRSYLVLDCPLADLEEFEPNRGRKEKETLDDDLIESMLEQGFTVNKIASELGTSWDAVKYRIEKIRKRSKD